MKIAKVFFLLFGELTLLTKTIERPLIPSKTKKSNVAAN
jgi:hypothetical protein